MLTVIFWKEKHEPETTQSNRSCSKYAIVHVLKFTIMLSYYMLTTLLGRDQVSCIWISCILHPSVRSIIKKVTRTVQMEKFFSLIG